MLDPAYASLNWFFRAYVASSLFRRRHLLVVLVASWTKPVHRFDGNRATLHDRCHHDLVTSSVSLVTFSAHKVALEEPGLYIDPVSRQTICPGRHGPYLDIFGFAGTTHGFSWFFSFLAATGYFFEVHHAFSRAPTTFFAYALG